MPSPDRSEQPRTPEGRKVQTAKDFRSLVRETTTPEGQRYHVHKENGIVHAAAAVQVRHGAQIEFLHCNAGRAGDVVGTGEVADEGLFLDLSDAQEGVIPTDAIVISDNTNKTRTTFSLYKDGTIVRTHAVGASSGTISYSGPSSSNLSAHAKVSRILEPHEGEALIEYATSPHSRSAAAVVATQLNREEQEKIDEALAKETKKERELAEWSAQQRERRFRDRLED